MGSQEAAGSAGRGGSGGSGGSSQPAFRQQGGGGAAATEAGMSAGAQRQESPQFVGVFNSGRAARPWSVKIRIDAKKYGIASCTTRAEAAAAHDLALIWKRLHGKGGRNARGLTCAQPMLQCHRMACVPAYAESENHPPIFNFPQLLDDDQLRGRRQGAPDVAALTAAVADWLQQQWARQGPALPAGRADALAR